MPRRPRKSSACVTLVLIGAATLAGCGDAPSTNRRAAYPTREACLADWGDPKDCEEQATAGARSRSWGPSSGTWHSYSRGTYRGGGSSSRGSSSPGGGHSVARGGFGSHGSSAS